MGTREEVLGGEKSNVHHFTMSVKIPFSLFPISFLSMHTRGGWKLTTSSNHDVMISTDFHLTVNSETQCAHIQNSLSGKDSVT